jgi:hypothetical protein
MIAQLLRWGEGAIMDWWEFNVNWRDLEPYASILITILATLLPFLTRLRMGANFILFAFVGVVIIFGGVTIFHYWGTIVTLVDDIFFGLWLAIAMIAGMFVHVLAKNYLSGKPLFEVDRDRLLFPLLFSFVVFYPIWGVAASAPRNVFVFYAAFLNGYFWENIVANVKQPVNTDVNSTPPPA